MSNWGKSESDSGGIELDVSQCDSYPAVDLAVDEQEYVRSDLRCERTHDASPIAPEFMPLLHEPHAFQLCLIALERSRDWMLYF
jgi:hypothetical protein